MGIVPLGHLVTATSISFASAYRRKPTHSGASPLPTEPAPLGFGGGPEKQHSELPMDSDLLPASNLVLLTDLDLLDEHHRQLPGESLQFQ